LKTPSIAGVARQFDDSSRAKYGIESGMIDSALNTLPRFAGIPAGAAPLTNGTSRKFGDLVRDFCQFGAPSVEVWEGPVHYLINEFWTSGQRQAHSLHEVSYRACFKPQLPEFFIERLTAQGDAVYDPFMGRGTTPIQAALMGRRPIGNDINPLSTLLSRPRLAPPAMRDVTDRLDQIPWDAGQIDDPELLAFYSEQTLRHLCALRCWLIERAPLDRTPDPVDDWIRMVAINRLTGHSPGFFSVYTLPPNQAVSALSQRKINDRRGQTPPDRDVKKLILRKSASLLNDGPMAPHPPALLTTGAAQSTPAIGSGSVQLVVTSPPFLDIVQYAEDNWLRSWFAGIDVAKVAIEKHRTEAVWQSMVRDTLIELARVVRPGGHVAFEVGEVRNGKVLLERLVWDAAEALPFDRLFVMVNQQAFTKTANCWGVRNNAKGTNTNRIVVLRRH
jgi:DNA methylase